MSDKVKGRFTFRFTAVCFAISAVGELFGLHDSVVLFGSLVGGAAALVYHLVYVALFAWLTVGLWDGMRSGYYMLIATTVLYTVDRLQLLFVGDALKIMLRQVQAFTGGQLPVADMDYIMHVLTISIITFVLCWWAFVLFAYVRRGYFGIR